MFGDLCVFFLFEIKTTRRIASHPIRSQCSLPFLCRIERSSGELGRGCEEIRISCGRLRNAGVL